VSPWGLPDRIIIARKRGGLCPMCCERIKEDDQLCIDPGEGRVHVACHLAALEQDMRRVREMGEMADPVPAAEPRPPYRLPRPQPRPGPQPRPQPERRALAAPPSRWRVWRRGR
jgi:hypothetical protein